MNALNYPTKAPERSEDIHPSLQVNNDGDSLSHHMNRMSLATASATALPPSSPVVPSDSTHQNGSPTLASRSIKTPIRRAPSSSSLGGSDKPSSPTIRKRTSANSLKDGEGRMPPKSPAARRSSSYFHNLSMGDRSSLPPPVEEAPKPPLTAASVAREFFEKELAHKHNLSETTKPAQSVVILQDACYGHRYSRPKTSKGSLSLIVERPERVHASLLGVATAYVRLGGRHAEGAVGPHPQRDISSVPSVPFTVHKTARTISLRSPAAAAVHGKDWMEELSLMCERAEAKLAANGKELTRENIAGQSGADNTAEKARLHEGDLYLCSESLNALEGALGGVCEGVDTVFSEKGPRRAFVCIRPPGHHCAADMPSGFCWINNVHVGIGHAALAHGLTHAAIIDFDLHHGDGSQSITWDHNARVASMPKNTPMTKKVPIGYFSLHDINSYPCEMGDEEKVRNASLCLENAHGQSIWNVHLRPWKTESEFWALYEDRYLVLLAKARAFLKAHNEKLRQSQTYPKPKAAIFLSAGFDASEWESPGMQRHQVHVPTEFYARFTRDVVKMAEEDDLGVEGRVISVLEGGYSDRALMSGTLSHISGLVTRTSISRPSTSGSNGIGLDLSNRVGSMDLNGGSIRASKSTAKPETQDYDPAWWSVPCLEELETLIDPMAHVALAPKGPRGKVQPTFTLPTESFISKVIDAPQGRRSTSGASRPSPSVIPRGPSPPPPEVGWATASLELRNLLVPSDRETKSCKAEDLNAEATRKRRDRQSNIAETGLPTMEPAFEGRPMQLREKRGKAPEIKEEEQKVVSRASRRKTIADPNILTKEDTPPPVASMPRPARRRSSAASSILSVGTMNTDRGSDFSLPSVVNPREPAAVKKARAPVVPRPEPTKPNVAVKRPPAARKLSSNPKTDADSSKRSNSTGVVSASDEGKSKDIDQLSTAMRTMSIKLNVPPKDESGTREPKPKAAPRGRPPGKTTAAKTTKARSPTKSKAKAPATAAQPVAFPNLTNPSNRQILPKQPENPLPTPPLNPQLSTDTIQRIPSPPNTIDTPSTQPSANHISPPLQPSQQHPAPVPSNSTAPPPNTPARPPSKIPAYPTSPPPFSPITPVQVPPTTPPRTTSLNTRENLPVFTSTSPISFGKPKTTQLPMQREPMGISQTLAAAQNANRPENPHLTGMNQVENVKGLGMALPLQPAVGGGQPGRENGDLEGKEIFQKPEGAERGQNEGGKSIWEVPDTPQPRRL